MKFDCLCFFSNRKDPLITLEDRKLAWEILTILEVLLSKHTDENGAIISPRDLLNDEDDKFIIELMKTFSNGLTNFQYENGSPFARKLAEWKNGKTEENIFVYTGERKSITWYRLHSAYTLEKGYRDNFITIGNLFETANKYLSAISQGRVETLNKSNPSYHILQALRSSKENGCLPSQRYFSELEKRLPDWFCGTYYGVCRVTNTTPLPSSPTPLNQSNSFLVGQTAAKTPTLNTLFSARHRKPSSKNGICDTPFPSTESLSSPNNIIGKTTKRRLSRSNGELTGTPLQKMSNSTPLTR